MSTHPTAAAGYGSAAGAYERGRPTYPDEAVAYLAAELGLGPAARVLDLAAGTGKLTRLLAEGGADVVAVEPVAAMRAVLAERCPGSRCSRVRPRRSRSRTGRSTLSRSPRRSTGSTRSAALAEIHRVLRPGGGLGLIWNMMDVGVEWVAVLQELVHGARGSVPAYGPSPWRDAFRSNRQFTPLTERTFAFVHELSEDGLVDRVTSTSYVAALPDAERQRLLGQVRTLAAGVPRPIRLPYRTDVFCCRRT